MFFQEVSDLFCTIASTHCFTNLNPVYEILSDWLFYVGVLYLSLEDFDINTPPGLTEVSLEDPIAGSSLFMSLWSIIFSYWTTFLDQFSEHWIRLAPELGDILSVERFSGCNVLANRVVLIWGEVDLDIFLEMCIFQSL